MTAKEINQIVKAITLIAGNVAQVALIDAGVVDNHNCIPRVEACERIKKFEKKIKKLLTQEQVPVKT